MSAYDTMHLSVIQYVHKDNVSFLVTPKLFFLMKIAKPSAKDIPEIKYENDREIFVINDLID